VIQTDLDPGLAAEMPAAVRAARQGQPRPLLRLLNLVSQAGGAGTQDVNDALNLATNCDDGSFPWQPATPLAERPALLQSALASLPNSSFGGLGSWARDLGTATECLDWPISPATPVAGSSTYPDIPVLALTGGFDLRTPTSAARGLVSRFPHGQLLRVANTGHSVLTSAPSSCVARSVRSWLAGREISQTCAAPRLLAPLPSFPKLTRPATHTATLQQFTETVHEAEATWLLAMSESGWQQASVAGLTSGRLAGTIRDLTLSHYGTGNRLEFSGKLHVQLQYDRPIAFEGILRITGQGATHTGHRLPDRQTAHGHTRPQADQGLTGSKRFSPGGPTSRPSARRVRRRGWRRAMRALRR
jgi:hypothetical protein